MAVEASHQKYIWKLIDKIIDKIVALYKSENSQDKDQENKSKNGTRTKSIIILILSLILIDYFLKISENFTIESKISRIEKIENLFKSKSLDLQTKQILIADQRKLALRHSWQSDFEDLMSLIHDTIKSPSDINSNATNSATIFRSNFWHILTSSWGFILIGIIIIFQLIITRGISVFDKIFVILLIGLILVFFILGISYLFATIPLINYPIVNYIINFILNGLVMYCIYFFGQKIERSDITSKLKF